MTSDNLQFYRLKPFLPQIFVCIYIFWCVCHPWSLSALVMQSIGQTSVAQCRLDIDHALMFIKNGVQKVTGLFWFN